MAVLCPRRQAQLRSRAECVRCYGGVAEERLPLLLYWNTSSSEFVPA